MSTGESIIQKAKQTLDLAGFREQNWTGTFAQYLDIVNGRAQDVHGWLTLVR